MVVTNDHGGPGVLPGRYPGAGIPICDGPTPQSMAAGGAAGSSGCVGGSICAVAAEAAQSSCTLLSMAELRRRRRDPVLDGVQVVGALAVLVLFDDAGGGAEHVRVASFAADATGCRVVPGGPVVLFEGG